MAVLTLALSVGAGILIARAAVTLEYFRATQKTQGIILEWATVSEPNYEGFYVNRRQPPEVNFSRIISSHTLPQGNDQAGASYVYTDTLVQDNVTYAYRMEIIYTSGITDTSETITVTYGLITPTPSLTSTPTGTLRNPTPSRTATRTPTASARTATPTRTATSRFPTSTRTGAGTATITQTPTITNTPTWTATFVPLPKLTLLFPVLTPTPTSSHTPTITPTRPALPGSDPVGKAFKDSRLVILGGVILLLWVVLGGFLVVYLRRLGY